MTTQSRRPGKRRLDVNTHEGRRQRLKLSSVQDLPWKSVEGPVDVGLTGEDNIVMLEEVEGVEVIYEDTQSGRVAKFLIRSPSEHVTTVSPAVSKETSPGRLQGRTPETDGKPSGLAHSFEKDSNSKAELVDQSSPAEGDDSFAVQELLPGWAPHTLHHSLYLALHRQNYTSPTPIQAKTIPCAVAGKDIIGVAETGSGKTLAYGLPILHHIFSHSRSPASPSLRALVLVPTRELALQVSDHLSTFLSNNEPSDKKMQSDQSFIRIGAIVGGMSVQRQRRLLQKGLDIMVATPGRLWDIMKEDDNLSNHMGQLRFLVLDEADRMVEAGHFAELESILRYTIRQPPDHANMNTTLPEPAEHASDLLQTFVFSATMSKDLQWNLKKVPLSKRKYSRSANGKSASTLDDLLIKLDFRDPKPEIIDLSPKGGTVAALQESLVECLGLDKDTYLYYFLLRYPGRSLVFLSSIDGIRRLQPLLKLLRLDAYPLHSQLQQRQRLKNLDRFKAGKHSILLATDVAARGLDIPMVDHVVHYQVPRSTDIYIHRNGRTARAQRSGFSLLLCAPDEKQVLKELLTTLGKASPPEMPIEHDLLDQLKNRIQVARKIEKTAHKIGKEKHEKHWLKKTAEAMDIQIDSDFIDSDQEQMSQGKKRKPDNAKSASLAELHRLLDQPLLARGIVKSYITSGASNVVDELLEGTSNKDGMLGFERKAAINAVSKVRGSAPAAKRKKDPVSHQALEWTGFDS